ncbi:hypothetical protein SAMN04488581_4362 [Mycolicibacterium neoaurum]|uniref:hypothetical protein n=1 Tax=Mycolicibacterium neoaurum TaxID=1795 RepID=UPI0005652BA9|nr:hypothetical protein [Mycolicibacterium neoaurum]SDE61664.1 hypothetical protein SAMN04488581_4362 [Mycolicibacterium neoaurum]
MFRLRRLYLDSVGVIDNRFSDLTVEMTDASGVPADSIVWLRNGAGKTTMLSLLLALIRPARRDFLAHKTKNRSLEDLILSGDTAHVVAEWVGPDGRLLLTGAVYEWTGRARPQDYNDRGGRDRLNKSWWCLTPESDLDAATLDSLPFYTRSNGQVDRERFCSHIRSLAARGASAAVVDTTIVDWHAALRERRFDPGLFEYFLIVNAAEGGIDGLFADIDSPEKFVRYLLRFVGNHEQIEPVRDLLRETAAEIAKRPMYLAEKEFCDDAQARLLTLSNVRAERDTAARTLAEEQHRAGRHKRSLLAAATAAADQATEAKSGKATIENALSEVRAEADMHRFRAQHYLVKAAEFAVADARSGHQQAKEVAEAATLTEKAWQAVEHHIDLTIRRAALAAKQAALRDSSHAAQPLQDRAENARAELAGALTREIDLATLEIDALDEQLDTHDAAFDTAQSAVDTAARRRIELETEQTGIHDSLANFELRTRALVDRGILSAEEHLAAAEQRLHTAISTTETEIVRLDKQRCDIEALTASLTAELERQQEAVNVARLNSERIATELRRLDDRASQLAGHSRIRALMQAEDIDLGRECTDVITALEHAKAAADRELVEHNQAIAAGERALHALNTTGLLPPRLQVQRIVDELAAANISAAPGWNYIAQHVDPIEHAQLIAELPAVVDGVIVYTDDLSGVADRIRQPVDDVVVLATSTVFEADRPSPQFILGPASAQHDSAAATVELDTRKHTQSELATRRDATDAQRRTDDELLSATRTFHHDLPGDGLDGLRARTASAASTLTGAQELAAATKARHQELATALETTSTELQTARARLVRAESDLPQVSELRAAEEDVITPSRRRLEAIPAELTAADQSHNRALAERNDARDNRVAAELQRNQTAGNQVGWRSELEALPPPRTTDLTLPAARKTAQLAQEQLRAEFPEETLNFAVTAAEDEATQAARRWNDHDADVRKRAEELAATTEANDPQSRHAARQRTAKATAAANVAVGATEIALQTANDEHHAARRNLDNRRSRRDVDVEEPDDQAHAQRLAATAATAVASLEDRRRYHEQEIAEHEAIITTQTNRSNMLTDQASLLSKVQSPANDVELALPADDDGVRSLIAAVLSDFESAASMHQEAHDAMDACADAVTAWANDDKFVHLAQDEHGNAIRRVREMLRDKTSIRRVAENAETLIDDLRLRSLQISAQLKQVDETKANIASKITDLVLDALTVLRRASALSELPEGIGAWDRKHFLDVAPRSNPSRDQVNLRVGDLVATMVNSRSIESDPAELLWRATNAAVPEGFKATVLKPSPEQATARITVADMRKWSGGENLTASLVLFCVMARLRAERRTEDRTSSAGGVLPLDNPVGKANYLPFLELQRKVARANGVQLVYWTGIGDLGAVTAFPRIAAMHKRPSTTRAGRAYVTTDQDTSRQVLDIASAVRREP